MRLVSLSTLVLALLWLRPASALASSSSAHFAEAAPPYRAWQGARFQLATPPLLERAPAPETERPERARRAFELGSELGLGLPHCASASGGCPLLGAGSEIAITLLARPRPYFALGASARHWAFELGSRADSGPARAKQVFVGLSARAYFLGNGRFDPYLELSLGGGPLRWLSAHDGGRIEATSRFAPGGRSAGGVDCWLTSWLRLGAFLAITRYFPSSVSHCDALGCSARRASSTSLVVGATSLGLSLTVAAGELL